jgi:hypothetical protein
MYNHYQGNTGRVHRVEDKRVPEGKSSVATSGNSGDEHRAPDGHAPENHRAARPAAPPPVSRRPPSPLAGLSGELGRLLRGLSPMNLETEDLLLAMVLYLLYRESGDEEMLYILAAMLLL